MPKKTIFAADLFCGAGGTTEALRQICETNKQTLDLIAVNHWPIAIDSHSANHPYAKHLCAKLEAVNPHDLVPGGRLNLLIAGIECTHHSNARGGRPRNDQSRSSAWLILKWASELYIETIIIENVKEFMSWGPLGADSQPMKSKKGELFLSFIDSLKKLTYHVEYKRLTAADFGDPTTRERLFIIGKRGKNRSIAWPAPTHAPAAHMKRKNGNLFVEKLQPWRVAREIIDWGNRGRSIFGRKKDLAPKTIERIAAGLRKQGSAAEPFLVMLYGTNKSRSLDRPVPTVTANGNHIGLCQPFVIGQQSNAQPRTVDEPIPTVATAGAISLIQPFILPMEGVHRGNAPRSIDAPVPTITAGRGGGYLVQPFLVQVDQQGSNGGCTRSVDEPVGTIITKQNSAVVEPFIMAVNHGDKGSASPAARSTSIDDPMPTVTANRGHAVIEPFLVKYYRTGKDRGVDEPLDTITATERFGLITTEQGTFKLDILFRMLTNKELARAQGLTDAYIFTGKGKDVTRQIGNMVPVGLAKAVIGAQVIG